MKNIFRSTVGFSAGLLLVACSGGGGGGPIAGVPAPAPAPAPTPGPTPTPTPAPVATNTSLLELTQSETFTNDSATTAGTFYSDARPCRCTGTIAPLTIRYDAGTQAYTVTVSGRSQTFRPSDIDASQSSAAITVYTRTSGSLTESLSLTRPGNSGVLTYKYVGGGYWQRVTTSGDHADFTFEGFTYGVETPDPAVPRTGSALYSIDLIGALGWGIPVALAGEGSMQLDFATGTLVAGGTIRQISIENGAVMGTGRFYGNGSVSSSTNLFNGNFSFEASGGAMAGSMQGRFYGPGAEEVGAVFAAAHSDGRAAAGTLTGRKTDTLGGNTSFTSLTRSQFFANDASVLRATYSGSTPTGESAGDDSLVVNYDAASGTYALFAADGRTYTQLLASGGSSLFVLQPQGPLRYVRTGLWTHNGGGGARSIDAVAFGMPTAPANVPVSGTGLYPLTLIGKLTDATQAGEPLDLGGTGLLTANFATGTINVSGSVTASYLPLSGRPPAVTGTFLGNGMIASGSSRFNGAFTLDVLGRHVGNFLGRFYGPNAEEVAATFHGKSADDNNVAVGMLFGGGVTDVPLTAINKDTPLSRLYGFLQYYYNPVTNIYGCCNTHPGEGNQPHLIYDPGNPDAIATYRGETADFLSFGAADRVAAESGAGIDVYRKTAGGKDYETRIYNPAGSGAPFALTYTSFATLIVRTPADPAVPATLEVNNTYTYLIGVPTSPLLAPRTGSASYHGIVAGRGFMSGSSDPLYELSGTSTLAVDFGALTARTTLTIQGTNLTTSGVVNFGSFVFDGQTGNFYTGVGETAGFGFNGSGPGGRSLQGFFFGRNAEEFGATFNVAGGGASLVGVTVGKKD